MKKQLSILILGLIYFTSFSQINFEKGYFINNSGQKTDCFIKKVDWKNNPVSFEYKEAKDSQVKTASIKNIAEFGIDNYSKYERHNVNIDRSSETLSQLSSDKNPIFGEEELFLEVLIEGQATLYLYQDVNLTRFFYKTASREVEQLIHKSYKNSYYNVEKNNYFRQQLYNNLNCKNSSINQYARINYSKNNLLKYFINYNKCKNYDYENYDAYQRKRFLNVNIRPGLNISNFEMYYANFKEATLLTFESEPAFRIGFELEFILPFDKNKWVIVVEPTYQYYETFKEFEEQNISVDYTSLEVPIGVRRYFYLNDNSKIFLNAVYIVDLVFDSNIKSDARPSMEISSKGNFGLGLGYTFNDRYTFECRYQRGRDLLGGSRAWKSNYNTLSFIVGYSLFNNL